MKDSIDWSHVSQIVKACARDEDGQAWLHNTADIAPGFATWRGNPNTRMTRADDVFASYRPGTCDWRESLITRPEGA
jgi:hypothetical protein